MFLASGSVFPCVPHEDLDSLAARGSVEGVPMVAEAPSSLMILQALKLSALFCPPELGTEAHLVLLLKCWVGS